MCCAAALFAFWCRVRYGIGRSCSLSVVSFPSASSIAHVASSCSQVRHPLSLCLSVAIALSFSVCCFTFSLHVVVADV